MSSLIMVRPEFVTNVVGSTALVRALTPDPKEAAPVPAAGASITLDYGAPVSIDTAFAGYHTAGAATQWTIGPNDGNPNNGITGTALTPASILLRSPGLGDIRHGVVRAVAPQTSRYWQVQFGGQASSYFVGTLALGLAFQPFYGREYGSGRTIEDTGSADRLKSGAFAIDEGVVASGWQWTMGDLTDTELRKLYTELLLRVGRTRTVLAVEDPDQTDGLNERIHWGVLTKIDTYERFAPGASRLALTIADWA